MNVRVQLGAERRFVLRNALLVYSDGGDLFAVVHDVAARGTAQPKLGTGQLVTMDFLAALAEGLGNRLAPEVLPDNVIARTPHLIAWWTRPHVRPLWYRHDSELGHLSGKHFPVPALLWKLIGQTLYVRALCEDARPGPQTQLFVAPFWNTNEDSLVCQGTMKRPETSGVDSLQEWVDGYFGAEFTHAYGNRRLTRCKGGYMKMWEQLEATRDARVPFPQEYLTPAKQSVREFMEASRNA